MHQQKMHQVAGGEMRLKVGCLSQENTRPAASEMIRTKTSEVPEDREYTKVRNVGKDVNAATNDTASCARSDVAENVRCRHKSSVKPRESTSNGVGDGSTYFEPNV